MSTLDAFLPEVRPWAPGVPDVAAHKAIRNAAIEFCQRTRLWRYEQTIAVLATDAATRTIAVPAGSEVFDFEVTTWEGREVTPKATRDLDEILPGWRTGDVSTGVPRYLTQLEEGTLRLVPTPSMDGSLYLCLRLQPSQTATELPAFLDKYREAIGWGALSRLLMVPGQSYSNPELATAYALKFLQKLDAKSIAGTIGQQNARKRTRPQLY